MSPPRPDRPFLPAASVEALYRHCHLKPPAVVMPASAVHFARAVTALAKTSEPGVLTVVMLVMLPCLPLALAGYELFRWHLGGVAPSDLDVGLVAYVGLMAVVLTSWYLARVAWPHRSLLALMAGCASGAACGAGIALVVGDWRLATIGAALGAALVTLAQVSVALLLPVVERRRIGRAASTAVPLLGSRPIHDIVRSRLELAARNLPRSPSAEPRQRARLLPDDQEATRMRARLDAEGRHLAGHQWHAVRPLLGSSASGGEPFTLERAARSIGDSDDLPAVLQAATALHASSDAATLLEGVAVVLPRGSQLEAAAPPREGALRSRRRSEQAAYRDVFAVLGKAFSLRCLVDLVWSDRIADRLLARRITREEDSVLRDALVRAIGVGRLVRAARLAPVHADDTGALYLVGPDRDPLAYVRVNDATAAPDRSRPQHWLRVPPHVATAREAVAWTFAMSEQAYFPSAET